MYGTVEEIASKKATEIEDMDTTDEMHPFSKERN